MKTFFKKSQHVTRQGMAVAGRLIEYTRPYLKPMALTFVLILAVSLLFNFLPVLIRHAIDDYIEDTSRPPEARTRGLLHLGILYLALALAAAALQYLQGLIAAWTGQRIVRDLRRDVFQKVLDMPRRFFDTTPVGKIITRVTSDVDVVQQFVSDGVVGMLADLFLFVGVLAFMTYLSPPLTGILLAIFPPMLALFILTNRHLREANRQIRQAQATLNANAQESIAGMGTIQLFSREDYAADLFRARNDALQDASLREVRWFSFYFPVLDVAQAIATVLVLALGGWLLLTRRFDTSLGVLIAFLTYLRQFFRPLDSLSNRIGSLQQALAACERLFGLLDEDEVIHNPAHPVAPPPLRGDIRFEHVWFAYQHDHWVLRDLSFHVPAGQSLAIVGATGSGKTTIINLVARFYDVQRGAVLLDGHDVRHYRKEDLRTRFGMVVQDPFLFSATIAENISLHDPAIGRATIEEAAHYVNAHDFITRLPQGYDTPLRERGAGLSAGQKQLLALARAWVRNREALLILDEATSNVDSETEQLIQDALNRLMQNRTCIIIAHRLSTIRHVDRILALHRGELVAIGSHKELMAQDGYYRRLHEYLSISPAP